MKDVAGSRDRSPLLGMMRCVAGAEIPLEYHLLVVSGFNCILRAKQLL